MRKILLVIFIPLFICIVLCSYPSLRVYMLKNNIWPYERKVISVTDTFFKDSNYLNKGIYRILYFKYNYEFKDTIHNPYSDLGKIDEIKSIAYFKNEYGDTIEEVYINDTKWSLR